MKFAKYLGALLLVVVGLFVFISNFSSISSNYKCIGEITSGENKEEKTIYIILTNYRWWVGLWSDSAGNVKLEIPNQHVRYYSHIVEVGNQRQIYLDQETSIKGNFSTLSKTLELNTSYGSFSGKCVAVP